jgi:hypothetical protein
MDESNLSIFVSTFKTYRSQNIKINAGTKTITFFTIKHTSATPQTCTLGYLRSIVVVHVAGVKVELTFFHFHTSSFDDFVLIIWRDHTFTAFRRTKKICNPIAHVVYLYFHIWCYLYLYHQILFDKSNYATEKNERIVHTKVANDPFRTPAIRGGRFNIKSSTVIRGGQWRTIISGT